MKILFFDVQNNNVKSFNNKRHQKAIAVPDWVRFENIVVADTIELARAQFQKHQNIELILASEACADCDLQLLSQMLQAEDLNCSIIPLKPYYDAFVEDGLIGKPASNDAWLGLENTIGHRETSYSHNYERRKTSNLNLGRSLAEVERELILETLLSCGGNRTYAADILGISVRTLRNKLVQYGEQGKVIPVNDKRKANRHVAAKLSFN